MKSPAPKKNSQSVLDDAPISLFRRLYQIATSVSAEVLAADGLIPLEYGMLLRIHANPGVDQITLAGLLALDRTTTSSVLFKLEKRGLVEREVNEADRRARVLRLTPKGLEIRDRLRPDTLAAQENIWSVLTSPERKQLIGMLQRVMNANRHYMRLGAGRRKRTKTRTPRKGSAVS